MEKLGIDNEKKKELMTGAMHACHLLNNVVMPIAKELSFLIDVSDNYLLDEYLRQIESLHDEYLEKTLEDAKNPALAIVLRKTAEELWEKAYVNHPIANPYIISELPRKILNYVTITGSDIYTFHARPNNPAIEKACIIEGTEEDIKKRDEIKEVCSILNRCFNGMGGLFSGYIAIQNGHFSPIRDVTNYKPLINGGY